MALFTHLSICSFVWCMPRAGECFSCIWRKSTWFHWMSIYMPVYTLPRLFCSSLAPLWRVCAVVPFAECDDFPSNQTAFIIIFSGCFVKMEHTHICINKILWPKLRMQTQCSTLNVPRRILDTRALLFLCIAVLLLTTLSLAGRCM